jgi:hypothetical protein
MSESQNLWKEDGTPRGKRPKCVFCGENKIGSSFDEAWCNSCGWKGTLTQLVELEFQARPGAWLLEFLEQREIQLGAFALWLGLGQDYQGALANIRKYTHQTPKGGPDGIKFPRTQMVIRWASYLGIDPGLFYRPRTAKE